MEPDTRHFGILSKVAFSVTMLGAFAVHTTLVSMGWSSLEASYVAVVLAAEQGHLGAQEFLGAKYWIGMGVVQDYVQSHMWLNLAASRLTGEDREKAVEARDSVALLMTPAQIAEAQRLAREWETAHPPEP